MNTERIEEYRIIVAANQQELSKQVTEAINEGWQPFGSFVRSEQTAQWSQAVVKIRPVVRRSLTDPLSVTKREA
jgi:hypothetical protein